MFLYFKFFGNMNTLELTRDTNIFMIILFWHTKQYPLDIINFSSFLSALVILICCPL